MSIFASRVWRLGNTDHRLWLCLSTAHGINDAHTESASPRPAVVLQSSSPNPIFTLLVNSALVSRVTPGKNHLSLKRIDVRCVCKPGWWEQWLWAKALEAVSCDTKRYAVSDMSRRPVWNCSLMLWISVGLVSMSETFHGQVVIWSIVNMKIWIIASLSSTWALVNVLSHFQASALCTPP